MEIDTGEIQALRKEIGKDRRRGAYFYAVLILTAILAAGTSVLASVAVNRRSVERETAARQATERAFCGIIVLLDDTYRRTPPPPGSTSAQLAKAVSVARAVNRCPS